MSHGGDRIITSCHTGYDCDYLRPRHTQLKRKGSYFFFEVLGTVVQGLAQKMESFEGRWKRQTARGDAAYSKDREDSLNCDSPSGPMVYNNPGLSEMRGTRLRLE